MSKPGRNPLYREFVRSEPCLLAALGNCRGEVEAAHSGPHGTGQKADDLTCLPLCGIEHHREGAQSYHKLGKRFFEHHGLDREAIMADLRKRFYSTGEFEKGTND